MKLTMVGMKAVDRDLTMNGLNLLSAPNGTGKSAVNDALRYLALGYVPALGRTPSATAALMRGSDLAVSLTLDDGRVIERTLSRAAGGSYRSGVSCSWLARAKQAEHEAAVLGLFGREEADVAEALDIRQLLSATPQQRAARIAALLEAGRSSATSRLEQVGRLAIARLVDLPEERLPKDAGSAFELVAEPQQEAWAEIRTMVKAKVEAGIEGALAWANEEKRRAADGVQKRIQAKAEIERRLASLPAAAGEVKGLEAERTRLEREIGAARERSAEAGRKVEIAASARAELAARKAQLAQAEETVKAAQLDAGDVSDAMLAEVQGRLDGLKPAAGAPSAIAVKVNNVRARLAAIEERIRALPPVESEEEAIAGIEALRARLGQATDSPWAEIASIGKRLAASKTEATRKDGMRLQALARKHAPGNPEDLSRELDAAEKALVKAHEKAEKVVAERAELEQARAKAHVDISDLQEVDARAQREQAAGFEVERAKLIKTRDAIAHHLDLVTAATVARDHARHALEHAERRVAELGAGPVYGLVDTTPLQQQLAKVQATLTTLGAAAAVKGELASIAREIERTEAMRQVCAAVEWALQRAREQEITEAGGPLVERMAAFLGAAGRREQPYFRASKGSCEIGWRRQDGAEIAIAALSGGEWVLFAAALTAAVIVLRGAPLRVLLVEAGETDDQVLAGLLAGIRAVADQLTCAIVATPRPAPAGSDDWTILTLDGMAALRPVAVA
jgi:hypothetical protein